VPEQLVVGVDAGATTTRCLVVTTTGAIVGAATGGGANLRSSGGSVQARFSEVLAGALGGLDPQAVAGGVIGVAGAGSAGVAVVHAAADMAWWGAGLPGRPRVVPDLDVAFVAGTASADGLLLLAGTGAAAASYRDRRLVRRCDGYGWLLGDEGSAVWLALRGLRAALDAEDGRGPATRLGDDLRAHLGLPPGEDLAQALIARVHGEEPARLGTLAPLVSSAARDGDPVAAGIVDAAADRLVAGLRAVAAGPVGGALVLAGSVLADSPVRAAVLARLADGPELAVTDAGPGAAGAAALALAELAGGRLDPDLHASLLAAAPA
jgi:glucosamine kinase